MKSLRYSQLSILYGVSFAVSVFTGILIPLVPIHAYHLGATPFELGLIGGIGPAIYSIVTLMSGKLSVSLSRRILIICSIILLAVTCSFYSFSSTPLEVLLAKILEGVSMGILWPPIESLISDTTSDEKIAVAGFGLSWSSGATLGALLSGPALMLELAQTFRLLAMNAFLLTILTVVMIKEPRRIRYGDSVSIFKSNESLRKAVYMEYLTWVSSWLYAFTQGIIFSFFPAHAEMLGMSGIMISACIFLLMAMRTTTFGIFGKLKLTTISSMILGAIFIGMGSLSLSLFKNYYLFLLSMILIGIGTGLLYSGSFHRVLSVETTERGLYTGLFECSLGVGYFIGPIIGGALASLSMNLTYLLNSLAAISFMLLVISFKDRYH